MAGSWWPVERIIVLIVIDCRGRGGSSNGDGDGVELGNTTIVTVLEMEL